MSGDLKLISRKWSFVKIFVQIHTEDIPSLRRSKGFSVLPLKKNRVFPAWFQRPSCSFKHKEMTLV